MLVCSPVQAGVDFDGVDDTIDIASTLGIDVDGVGAMVCRIYIQDTAESGAFFHIGEATGACPGDDGFAIGVGSGTFDSDGNEAIGLKSCIGWCDGNDAIGTGWHTVGFNWNTPAGNFVEAFIDGVSGTSYTCGDPATAQNSSTIGGEGSGARNFDGIISWCAAWNATLGADEHLNLHNPKNARIALQIKPGNLKGLYVFDDCADGSACNGTSFSDMSSTRANGTGNDGADNSGLTGSAE